MPTARRKARLVVLNHNGGELTLRALRHLLAVEWPEGDVEVVCIDNASTDGSIERVEAELADVRVVRNGRNGGFPANNLALGDLGGLDFVGLVNNDAFVAPDFLGPLVATLDADPEVGAACPKLVLAPRFLELGIATATFVPGRHDPRTLGVQVRGVEVGGEGAWSRSHVGEGGWGREVDRAGPFEWTSDRATLRVPVPEGSAGPWRVRLVLEAERTKDVTVTFGGEAVVVVVGPRPTTVELTHRGPLVDVVNNVGSVVFTDGAGADRGWLATDDGRLDEPVDVFAWCGGGVLFRPSYLADVGLFDERFFLYYEDTDLSWRGQARGWRYRTAPSSVLRHVHAATSGEGSEVFAYHVERNRLLMLVKDAPAAMARREVWRFVLVTASYARRDVVVPLLRGRRPAVRTVRRRLVAFGGFLRLLPAMLADRRRLRRAQRVPDAELVARLEPR